MPQGRFEKWPDGVKRCSFTVKLFLAPDELEHLAAIANRSKKSVEELLQSLLRTQINRLDDESVE